MARPNNADAATTMRRLIEAALKLFAAYGYEGASTRAICVAAGVNVNTLNHHFASKQGLYDSTVDEVYRRLAARVGIGADQPQSRT